MNASKFADIFCLFSNLLIAFFLFFSTITDSSISILLLYNSRFDSNQILHTFAAGAPWENNEADVEKGKVPEPIKYSETSFIVHINDKPQNKNQTQL